MNKTLSYISNEFMSGMNVTVHSGGDIHIPLTHVSDGNETVWTGEKNGAAVTFCAKESGEGTVFFAHIKTDLPMESCGLTVKLDLSSADRVTVCHQETPWWTMTSWPSTAGEIRNQTRNLILEKDGVHYSVLCLIGDVFRCECDGTGLHLNSGFNGLREYSGPFLAVYPSGDPISAVEKNYKSAREKGGITVPLREERKYPEIFEKFGWCSWDAFYTHVSSEKLYSKLDELKAKNIPVEWIIIDDGWSLVREGMLSSFDADPAKFPEGLKECVRRIKSEYGISQVGVWHSLNAYWGGIDPDSDIAATYADYLITSTNGMTVPSDDPELAFGFWDAWHGYLADCGVDFVKVDYQSVSRYIPWNKCTVQATRNAHIALERSVNRHFGGKIINCMGMDGDNILSRPASAISRNSSDFKPQKEDGFSHHLRQNVGNAIWHSQIHYCDFDMWWSGDAEPEKSGVLRAISGGPVYVSDAIGGTEMAGLVPVCGKDGDILRLDNSARPTFDCIYEDCTESGRLYKVYNSKGNATAMAVYNITAEEKTETFTFGVIPDVDKKREYVSYEYFSKKYSKVRFDTEETVTLAPDKVLSYSLYPVCNDGEGEYIMLGDPGRYIGVGAKEKTKVYLKDIL